MITLHTFGPNFGLPDPSPFVTKAEMLLKMSGRPYRTDTEGFGNAPKGKLPYIEDDGARIADSTFIRWHLEKKYQIDFDRGLTAGERGTAWAFEKMAEDHLYWALLHARWMDDANFAKGPVVFFRKVPAPVRPIVVAMIRRHVRKALHAHGMGLIVDIVPNHLGVMGDDNEWWLDVLENGPDELMTIVFPLVAITTGLPLIGWAKPVPVDFRHLRHPRRDFAIVAAAGPASNIVLAVTGALILTVLGGLDAARARGGPGGRIVRRDQYAIDAVTHELGDATEISTENGNARSERFEHH